MITPLVALLDRCLLAFNTWFSSRAGVWQTLLITLLIVTVEQLFPDLDPQHFFCLYALTVYSASTQPALAFTGQVAAERLEAMQRDHESLLTAIHALTAQQNAMLAAIQETEQRELAELARIEPDLARTADAPPFATHEHDRRRP